MLDEAIAAHDEALEQVNLAVEDAVMLHAILGTLHELAFALEVIVLRSSHS